MPRDYQQTHSRSMVPPEARYGREMGRSERSGSGRGWLVAGLAVLGLGILAWNSFGPDVVRYMKIREM